MPRRHFGVYVWWAVIAAAVVVVVVTYFGYVYEDWRPDVIGWFPFLWAGFFLVLLPVGLGIAAWKIVTKIVWTRNRVVFILAAIVLYGIFLGFCLPTETPPRRPPDCLNNIRQIGIAMWQYAEDHEGKFPDTFGDLFQGGYVTVPKLFVCRSSRHQAPEDFQHVDLRKADASFLKAVDEWSDYAIGKGVRSSDPANFIILHEKFAWHADRTRTCFFVDGHAQCLREAEFQKRMKEQETKLRETRRKKVE